MNRSIRRLNLLLVACFAAVMVMLGYWQIVAAGGLNNRAGNPNAAERARTIDRGRIITADGLVLATSVPRRVNGETIYERVYPQPTLAPHVVGYSSPGQGSTGIEASANDYLAGSYGTEPLLQRLRLGTQQGADVHLTLDSRVQRAAQQGLAGRAGAVVALDPTTGAVLALASDPGFDLSQVHDAFASILRSPGQPLLDRATQGRYAPGSAFKVVTLTAALESGRYTPTSRFDDTGTFVVHGQAIHNFNNEVFGPHDLTTALTDSINTTFARIGQSLGMSVLGKTMTAFGFGTRPPIDLPSDEVAISGRYRNGRLLANGGPGDPARLAIGQELLGVTPLQMAMVAAAIANGGTLVRPYLISHVVDRGGSDVYQAHPAGGGVATTPQTAAAVGGMMQRVVQEGTGTRAALAGLEVAGKTGTAQTGTPGVNQAWFIGFAPASRPRVAVAVVIERTTATGGIAAAPVAAAVMRAAIQAGGGGA